MRQPSQFDNLDINNNSMMQLNNNQGQELPRVPMKINLKPVQQKQSNNNMDEVNANNPTKKPSNIPQGNYDKSKQKKQASQENQKTTISNGNKTGQNSLQQSEDNYKKEILNIVEKSKNERGNFINVLNASVIGIDEDDI
eukprot:TRINITY_DN13296_c0_g1_i1.p2 TRINITY_DN13296_c0_g1~~TRINITY_DN13296_c0_g1_i1.p2  ORF type:complete len:140 (+),score=29.94 TRINITY_DN13296_c0_g1_i1:161-580(+)